MLLTAPKFVFPVVRLTAVFQNRNLSAKSNIINNLKSRMATDKLVSYKINETNIFFNKFFQLKTNPTLKCVVDMIRAGGYEARVAGGAVRDLLLNKYPTDVDLATTATPDQMIELFSKHKQIIRLIVTDSGLKHGTIIVRVKDKDQYEVTTLRMDVKTDGRHADVQFIEDWGLDAARRDLTINAMFLDLDGIIYDYFDGINDLLHQRVRFVGDAAERIMEDYCRILRFFRFLSMYGDCKVVESNVIEAILEHRDGLTSISGERIWMELKKILLTNHSKYALNLMLNLCAVGPQIGFKQGNKKLDAYQKALETINSKRFVPYHNKYDAVNLFAALVDDEQECESVLARFKCSKIEKRIISDIVLWRNKPLVIQDIISQLVMEPKHNRAIYQTSMMECLRHYGHLKSYEMLKNFIVPTFPVRGNYVAQYCQNPRTVSKILNILKQKWIDSDFKLTEHALLKEAEIISKQIEQKKDSSKQTGNKTQ